VNFQTAAGTGQRWFYQPFGARELISHGPGGVFAKALSSGYRIAWYGGDGVLRRVIERADVQGPALTAEERDRAEEELRRDAELAARMGGGSPRQLFDVPSHKPPLAYLGFDAAGRLWAHRSAVPGEARTADVYTEDGALAFTAVWPADIDLTFNARVYDGVALGIQRDSLGVESVVRVRLH
jgi:hypothetical protein